MLIDAISQQDKRDNLNLSFITKFNIGGFLTDTAPYHREALQDFSASQLRLMFAMQAWNKEMTFGKTMKEEMAAKEHGFKHFFNNVDILLRRQTPVLVYEVSQLWHIPASKTCTSAMKEI